MKGARFRSLQPNVTIKFYSDDVIVTKMFAQVNTTLNPPSNIRQICVSLYDRNGIQLTYPNKTTIPMLISPMNTAKIEGLFEGVKTIRVQLCNTSDGLPPTYFRFAVVGCYSSRRTYILNTNPTASPQYTTTSSRKKIILKKEIHFHG